MELGHSIDIVLRNTWSSTQAEIDAFNRLNHPGSPHQVILLFNKATEGWDCPSLFACALARKLRRSRNFVLQASTRCLRQVPANHRKARICLSMQNRGTLDRQLQENYGQMVQELNRTGQHTRSARLVVRKMDVPPLVVKNIVRHVVPIDTDDDSLQALDRPDIEAEMVLVRQAYTLQRKPDRRSVLQQVSEDRATYEMSGPDVYHATELAAVYRLHVRTVCRERKRLYDPGGTVPEARLRLVRG